MKYLTLKPDRQTFTTDNKNENGVRPPQPNDSVKVSATMYKVHGGNTVLELTNGAYSGVTIDQEGLYNLPLGSSYSSQAGGRFELTNTKVNVVQGSTTAYTPHEGYIAIQVSTGDQYIYSDYMRYTYGHALNSIREILPNGNYWVYGGVGNLYEVKYATQFRESYVEAVPGVSYIESEGKPVYNELPLIAINGQHDFTFDELKITDKVLEKYAAMADSGRFQGEAYNIILDGGSANSIGFDSDGFVFTGEASDIIFDVDVDSRTARTYYPAPPT